MFYVKNLKTITKLGGNLGHFNKSITLEYKILKNQNCFLKKSRWAERVKTKNKIFISLLQLTYIKLFKFTTSNGNNLENIYTYI